MLGSYHEVCSSMKSKRFYVVISITAFVGIALWTLYQQVSSHPVDTWNHYSGKRHRKITSFSPQSEVSGGSWPVEKHRFLPNFFLLWDKEKSPRLSSYSDGNIIFLHHNKAGGISIRKCMQAVGPESGLNVSRNVFSYRYTAREFDYWKHAARTKQRMGLYGGYSFGVCDVITDGRPCSYFTMIRDPYDRAVSAYLYCSKNASKDQLCTALRASEVSVVDWAIHHGSFFFRQLVFNPAVCNGSYDNSPYLSNFDDFPHKFASDVIPCWFKHKVLLQRMLSKKERLDLLKHVHDNLENYFAVIGLLDNFDLTMGMLQHVYHVPFRDRCSDTHKNQGRFRKRRQKIEADLLVAKLKRELLADPRVNASLHADLVLYEKAKQIFNRQKEVFKYLTKTTS